MYNPRQLLRNIIPTGKNDHFENILKGKNFFIDYVKYKLSLVKPNTSIVSINDADNKDGELRGVVLNLIKSYQIYFTLGLNEYRINTLLNYKNEQQQIPAVPNNLNDIPKFASDLVNIPDFELTLKNQNIKFEILESFKSNINDLAVLDHNDNLKKVLIINDIIKCSINEIYCDDQSINEKFKLLKYDQNTHYLLCLLYFMNPYKLDKFGRLNQICDLLLYYQKGEIGSFKIDENDWNLLIGLITSNSCSFFIDCEFRKSFILNKIIELVNNVDNSYFNFNLVEMLRFLRNAESGYENLDVELNKSTIVKFNINYYRYLIIERAINEWNKDSLSDRTWNMYRFNNQWNIVWDTYYNNDNINPPGGVSFKKYVQKIAGK